MMQKFSLSRFVVPGIAGIVGAMAADFVFAPLVRANVPGWGGFAGGFGWRLAFAILFGFAAGRLVRRGDLWSVRFPRKGPKLWEWAAVAGIILVMAAVLFPVFESAHSNSHVVGCLSNAKQLGLATMMYAQDYDGKLFPVSYRQGERRVYWFGVGSAKGFSFSCKDGLLYPYLKNESVFDCPVARQEKLPTYSDAGVEAAGQMTAFGLNRDGLYRFAPEQTIASLPPNLTTDCEIPAETIVFAEAARREPSAPGKLARAYLVSSPAFGLPEVHARHSGKANVVWADGHAKALPVTPRYGNWETRLGDVSPEPRPGSPTPSNNYYFDLRKSDRE